MDKGKGRNSPSNCVSPLKQSCVFKWFHRPCHKLNANAFENPSCKVKDSCNLKIPKTCASPLFHGMWLLFPKVHAASSAESRKSVFSLEQSEETGMERLKVMFRTTEHGNISPELNIVTNTIGLAGFIGAFIGGTLASRTAVEKLVRQYQSAVFNHQFEAKRLFQDRITLMLAGTAFKWAWRLAFFSGTYTAIVVSATVYNNKSSIWEHIAAGAFTGSMWKLKMGLRATAVGGGLGSILGLFAGCLSASLLWLSGTSIEEMRYWHHDYWEREYKRKVKLSKDPEKIIEVLAIEHDEMLEDKKALLGKDSS